MNSSGPRRVFSMGGPNNNDDIIDSEDEIFDNPHDLKKGSLTKGTKTLRASRK
jgi:hypothetical protein